MSVIGNLSKQKSRVDGNVYTKYGISIDLANSNPETAVTYTDDAVGMTGGSSEWMQKVIFKDIKPCLLKNGVIQGYLNPNNFAQYEDGSVADITTGNSGDVMIEIPKVGVLITTNGNVLTIQVTDEPNAQGFNYFAHTRRNDGDRTKLYVGAFLGSSVSGKLRSLSGKSPLNNTTIGEFRTLAKANGVGYDQFSFYPMTLLQCLFLIKYKNRNSQKALGMGYVGDTDWEFQAKPTGATLTKGMDYGSTDDMEQMKFLGIEDFWGNLYQWIDGLVSSDDLNILTAYDNFNDTGLGYMNKGKAMASGTGGYMKIPQGTTEKGFIIKTGGGSDSTYFADYGYFYGGCVPCFGGSFGDGSHAGAFQLSVFCDASIAYDYIGGRLMYL